MIFRNHLRKNIEVKYFEIQEEIVSLKLEKTLKRPSIGGDGILFPTKIVLGDKVSIRKIKQLGKLLKLGNVSFLK